MTQKIKEETVFIFFILLVYIKCYSSCRNRMHCSVHPTWCCLALNSQHSACQLGGEVKARDSPGFLSDLSHGSEGNYWKEDLETQRTKRGKPRVKLWDKKKTESQPTYLLEAWSWVSEWRRELMSKTWRFLPSLSMLMLAQAYHLLSSWRAAAVLILVCSALKHKATVRNIFL